MGGGKQKQISTRRLFGRLRFTIYTGRTIFSYSEWTLISNRMVNLKSGMGAEAVSKADAFVELLSAAKRILTPYQKKIFDDYLPFITLGAEVNFYFTGTTAGQMANLSYYLPILIIVVVIGVVLVFGIITLGAEVNFYFTGTTAGRYLFSSHNRNHM
mgnify:CR=1 FL=1